MHDASLSQFFPIVAFPAELSDSTISQNFEERRLTHFESEIGYAILQVRLVILSGFQHRSVIGVFFLTLFPWLLATAAQPVTRLSCNITRSQTIPQSQIGAYPHIIVVHSAKLSESEGEEILLAGYGLREKRPTKFGSLQKDAKLNVSVRSFDEVSDELKQLQRLDDSDRFDLPIFWCDDESLNEPIGNAQITTSIARKDRAKIIAKTLEAAGDIVTGGVNSEFFFYAGNRKQYSKDFWKTPAPKPFDGIFATAVDFHNRLAARNIQLLLVLIPQSTSIYPGIATNIDYNPTLDGRVNFAVGDLAQALSEQGVDVLDLTETMLRDRYFQGEDGQTQTAYHRNDTHWAPYGVKLAAIAIADKIAPHLQTPQSQVALTESSFVTTFQGDIRLLQSKGAPKEFPALEAPIFVVKGNDPASTEWLNTNHSNSPVQLIGDSFARIYLGAGADIASHLKHLLKRQVFSTHRAGGAGVLRAEWLQLSPSPLEHAETVVWIFSERFCAVPQCWKILEF